MKIVYTTVISFLCLQIHSALCGVDEVSYKDTKGAKTSEKATEGEELKGTIKWPFSDKDYEPKKIQSPVDVITNHIIDKPDLPPLKIHEPLLPNIMADVVNSGKTAVVYIEEDNNDKLPFLEGGPLKDKFLFEQMHFHWGKHDEWGSEHFIDGEAFSMEIHIVFFNTKYDNFNTAANKEDGLAVLTVFAQTGTDSESINLFDPIYNILPKLHNINSPEKLPWKEAMKWAISGMKVNEYYYTYPGSLTTGRHTQNVAFILLPKPITLSHDQLEAFRKLPLDDEGHAIVRNKRKLQPLNHRPIFKGKVILEFDIDEGAKETAA